MTPHRPRTALAALVAASSLLLSACAPDTAVQAEPVLVEELAAGAHLEDLAVSVAGPLQVVFRSITLASGAGTGEHCHAGQLIAVVEQGTLTHYAPVYPGGVREYHAGEAIVEGSGYIHEGRNEGDQDVVLWVAYLIPEGEPLAQADLDHCDPR